MRKRRNPFAGRVHDEVMSALRAAAMAFDDLGIEYALVGGLSMSYHYNFHPSDDVDFAVVSDDVVPEKIVGFKRLRPRYFEHRETGVTFDILTPSLVNVPISVFDYAVETAKLVTDKKTGVRFPVATKTAIFALKASSMRLKDKHHLVWMFKEGYEADIDILADIGVPKSNLNEIDDLVAAAEREIEDEEQMGWR